MGDFPDGQASSGFGFQSWIAQLVLLLVLAASLFLFVWYEHTLLFMVFAGFLFAVVLQSFAAWIERHTGIKHKYSYTMTVLAVSGAVALVAALIAPRTIQETGEIAAILPHALHQVRSYLDQRSWGTYVVRTVHRAMNGSMPGVKVANFALVAVQAMDGLVIIVVVGFFGALNPKGYARTLLRLLPARYQPTGRQVGSDLLYTMRWWLLSQLVPMTFLGGLSMLGLWLLHVPLPFTLGLFTGFMIFIPYVGALLSGIPPLLLGLTVSPQTALYVLILYSLVHLLEGYILTPMVQKRAVRLPPLVTILAQLLMWTVAGFAGVLVATPMAAAALVLIKTLYLKEPLPRSQRASEASAG